MGNTLNKNTDIINISQIKDEGKSFQVKEGTSRKESTRCIDVQESNKTLSVIQEENHSSPSIFTHSKSSNKNSVQNVLASFDEPKTISRDVSPIKTCLDSQHDF